MTTSLSGFFQTYLGYAVKVAVFVGATCALVTEVVLPFLGVAHIQVPTWTAVVVGSLGGIAAAFKTWATDHGVTPAALLERVRAKQAPPPPKKKGRR